MARNHARILTTIWTDQDFVSLTTEAQRLYILMCSQPNLNYAGVIPFQPKRWATLSANGTVRGIERATNELESARFVVVDRETDELLVRSFVRHDGVLKSPNMCRAMVKDYIAALSPSIRAEILKLIPRPLPEPLRKGFPEGFPEPFAKDIGEGSPCVRAPAPQPQPQLHLHGSSQVDPSAPPEPPAGQDAAGGPAPDEDHHGTATDLDRVIALAVGQLEHNATLEGNPVRNPAAWRKTVAVDLRQRHATTVTERLRDGWTAEQAADGIIDPHYQPRPPTPDLPPDWTPEQRAANHAASADARARAKAAARRPTNGDAA